MNCIVLKAFSLPAQGFGHQAEQLVFLVGFVILIYELIFHWKHVSKDIFPPFSRLWRGSSRKGGFSVGLQSVALLDQTLG